MGSRAGDPEVIRWAELANEHEPELHRYDRFGHRIDTVEYHPAYHHLMTEAVAGRPARRAVGRRPAPVPTSCAPPGSPCGRRSRRATAARSR